jgi:hypothetical protein
MGQVSFFITIQWNAVGSVPNPRTFATDPDPAPAHCFSGFQGFQDANNK